MQVTTLSFTSDRSVTQPSVVHSVYVKYENCNRWIAMHSRHIHVTTTVAELCHRHIEKQKIKRNWKLEMELDTKWKCNLLDMVVLECSSVVIFHS